MAKRTNKITVSKCSIEFREGIAYLIEHTKTEDIEYLLEYLVGDLTDRHNLAFSLGSDLEI